MSPSLSLIGHVVDPTSKRGKKKPPQVRRKRWIRTVIPSKPIEQEEKSNASQQDKEKGKDKDKEKSRILSRNNQPPPEEIPLSSNKETRTSKQEGKKDKTVTSSSSAAAKSITTDGTTNKTTTATGAKPGTKQGGKARMATTSAMVNHNDIDVEDGDEEGTGARGVDDADFEVDSDQGSD